MKEKNPAAVALGKLAAGKKKKYSKAEIAKRTKRILEAGRKRKEKKDAAIFSAKTVASPHDFRCQ